MKTIKIFLGSSITEFQELRTDLDEFVKDISKFFEKNYKFKIEVLRCDDGKLVPFISDNGTQKDYIDPMIIGSDICMFVIGDKLGEYTKGEFALAEKLFNEREDKLPKIAVYFNKKSNKLDELVKEFKDYLDKDKRYFYREFENGTNIKLSIVAGLKCVSGDTFDIKYDAGKCIVDGKNLFSVKDLYQVNSNIDYVKLKIEFENISERYYDLKPLYADENTKESVREEYTNIASKRDSLENQLINLEKNIFKMSLNMVTDSLMGEITPRLEKAFRRLDNGDYTGALAILDIDDITNEYEKEEMIDNIKRETRVHNYISELVARISILETQTAYKERFDEIKRIYEIVLLKIRDVGIEFELIESILDFYINQNICIEEVKKNLDLIEKDILVHWINKIEPIELAKIYNKFGVLYYQGGKVEEVEKYYLLSLNIIKNLYEKDPAKYKFALADAYNDLSVHYCVQGKVDNIEEYYLICLEIRKEFASNGTEKQREDLSEIYNNLGYFYHKQLREIEAEKYYLLSIEIMEDLAGNNPKRFNGELAWIYNNLGDYYDNIHNYGESKKFYSLSLEIRKILALDNPNRYNGELAESINNLGIFYCRMKDYDKAKEYFSRALLIRQELAKTNPTKFNFVLSESYNNLASIYKLMHEYEESEKYYILSDGINRVLIQQNSGKYYDIFAWILNNIGDLYFKWLKYDKAENYFLESIAIRRQLSKDNPNRYCRVLAESLNNLGRLYDAIGKVDEAKQIYSEYNNLVKNH